MIPVVCLIISGVALAFVFFVVVMMVYAIVELKTVEKRIHDLLDIDDMLGICSEIEDQIAEEARLDEQLEDPDGIKGIEVDEAWARRVGFNEE